MKTTVVLIALSLLAFTFSPAGAVPSLEVQRQQREASEQRRHEIELARIQAAALVEAAKYASRRHT